MALHYHTGHAQQDLDWRGTPAIFEEVRDCVEAIGLGPIRVRDLIQRTFTPYCDATPGAGPS